MDKFLALRASAGSGKTFNLVVRYITLLFSGAKPNEILTLTFTNKSANEMKMRIFDVVKNLAKDEQKYQNYLNEIAKNLKISKEQILAKQNSVKLEFLQSQLNILTIDKFLNKILRNFCWYANTSLDFEIKADKKDSIKSEFLKNLDESLFENLIEFLLLNHMNLNSIFDILYRFYSKESEFNSEIDFQIDFDLEALEIEILNALEPIKNHYLNSKEASSRAKKAVEFSNIKELFNVGKTWLSKDYLEDYSYFKKKSIYDSSLESNLQEAKELLSRYFSIKEQISIEKLFKIYNHFKNTRAKYKKSKNELSFDDITNLVYSLLSKIENEFLYFRLDSKISHILIDEFQDTSISQFKIFEPLIGEMLSSDKTFFYVGDTKQSIYRFRGSKQELFNHLITLGADSKTLNINYRSKSKIVEFVNEIFLKDKIKTVIGYERQNSNDSENRGFIRVIKDDEVLENLKEQVEFLKSKNIDDNDIAILTFKNSDVLKIKSFLDEHFKNIKTQTDTSSLLINQQSPKAIINLLKYLYFKDEIYRSNFLTLIEREPFSKLDLDGKYNLLLPVTTLIKNISDDFHIFDEHILKLIETSFQFKNLTEFIYEIDHLDTSIDSNKNRGIKIMTIHKSKGLEFKHLIVIDRLSGVNKSTSPILFDYEDINLSDIKYKMKLREAFDKKYKDALKKEEREVLIDRLNTLYVALTRAEDSLFLLIKDDKNSEFNTLDITPLEIGELESSKEKTTLESTEPLELKIRDYGRQSDLIDEEEEYKANDLEAILFGNATHFMLEHLYNFDESALIDAKEKTNNRYGIYLNEKIDSIYEIVLNLLKTEEFQKLTEGEIYKETPISFDGKLQYIDLMVEFEDKIYIIDYKTSKESYKSYRTQIENYKKAIKTIKQKETFGYLCFINSDNIKIERV